MIALFYGAMWVHAHLLFKVCPEHGIHGAFFDDWRAMPRAGSVTRIDYASTETV